MDKVFPRFSAVFCAAIVGLLVTGGLARVQARRSRAEITPLVELSGAHPENTLRLALKVSLAEWPDESPVKAVMHRFNAVGLPTYVILQPATGR